MERLVTDYLQAISLHVKTVLQHKLPAVALVSTPISYCLTVPAIWSESAQAKTLACASAAGLGSQENLIIVSEPEAAAVFALDAMNPHALELGDSFVLCDAGGGTVDLITYRVQQLRPILQVEEVTAGTGGMCGSTFIDRRFHDFLVEKLKDDENFDSEILVEVLPQFKARCISF